MNKSVSGFLEKLEEINDEKIKVYIPSIKKEINTTPLTLKQQKDLIASTLDGVKGLLNFNKTNPYIFALVESSLDYTSILLLIGN